MVYFAAAYTVRVKQECLIINTQYVLRGDFSRAGGKWIRGIFSKIKKWKQWAALD